MQVVPFDFSKLKDHWPAPIVSRSEIENFTGGALNRRTLANLDSMGEGPANRFKIGRKVCYPVEAVCEWLKSRASVA